MKIKIRNHCYSKLYLYLNEIYIFILICNFLIKLKLIKVSNMYFPYIIQNLKYIIVY